MTDRSASTLLGTLLLGLATTAALAAVDAAFTARNERQHLQAVFSSDGLEVSDLAGASGWRLQQQLRAVGPRDAMTPVSPSTPSARAAGVEYAHPAGVSERYVDTPDGLQQWFTVERAPRDVPEGAPLVLDFGLSGGLTFEVDGRGRNLYGIDGSRGAVVVTRVWRIETASGRVPYAELQATEDGFQLVTQVAEDDYPVSLALATGHPKTLALRMETTVSAKTLTSSPASSAPVEPMAAPANDTCAGAQIVPAAGPFPYLTTPVNVAEATTGGDPTIDCSFQDQYSHGVWYRFVPTQGGVYNISTCAGSAPGTTLGDTVLSVFTLNGSCGNGGTQLACNDDGSCAEPYNRQSSVSLTLTAGTTYYIVVYSWDPAPAANAANVQVRVEKVPPPQNETCAAAAPLSLGVTAGTVLQGVNDYSLSGTTCFSGVGNTSCTAAGRDTVYRFTAPSAGNYSFRVKTVDAGGSGNLVLYSSPTCPGPSALACDATRRAANRNSLTTQYTAAEEIVCQPMTSGQVTYLFVDECALSTLGGGYTLEAWPCGQETEANGTPATANAITTCPAEGAIATTSDVDFFSLGTPANNTRVFAITDGIQTNDADFDLRVTTATDTLEFDDENNSLPWGELGAHVAGTRLTGVASYLRVNHHTSSRVAEPYQLFRVLQPPGGDPYNSSSSPEQRDFENDSLEGAEAAGNYYYRGTLTNTDDLDAFRFCAVAGDWITIGMDMDPGRNNTPINSLGHLYDQNGEPLLIMQDAAATGTSTTSGAGNLASTTPSSNGEAIAWRARYTGAYYTAAGMDPNGTGTLPASADYLVSVGLNCQNGASQTARLITDLTAPVSVNAGSTFSYHVILSNTGTNTALNAEFTDVLPAGVQFVEVTGSGTDAGICDIVPAVGSSGTLHCQVPCLRPGGSWDFNIVVQATNCQGNGSILNSVTASTLTAQAAGSVLLDSTSTAVTDNGTCDDLNACTVNDHCSAGACVSTPVGRPAPIPGFGFTSKTAVAWTGDAWATEYDMVRGNLSSLPVGPGGGDEVCFGGLTGTSTSDAAVPSLGTGFWYVVRGQNACTSPGSYGNNGQGMQRVTSTCP